MTRLITLAAVPPISRFRRDPSSKSNRVSSSTSSRIAAVSIWSGIELRWLSVRMTTASIAPGEAMDGIASGKTAPAR